MFRDRRISFIVGASIAAIILIFQAIPPFNQIASTFGTPDRAGLGLLQTSWILLLVFGVLIVIAGVVGALFLVDGKLYSEKLGKCAKIYGIVYNVILFALPILCMLILISDGISILDLYTSGEPEVLHDTVVLTQPAFYIAFLLAYFMPTASYVRRFKKQQA